MEFSSIAKIKRYYKIFGYINLIFSVLLIFFLSNLSVEEQITGLITINAGYHVLYLFFSSLSKDKNRMRNSFSNVMGTGMLKLFAVFGAICSLAMIYFFITKAIYAKEFFGLFGICIPFGLLLGAYRLWTDLNND